MKNENLIERQQKAINQIIALGENGKRAMGYKLTFLNKKGRGLNAIYRRYRLDAEKLGYAGIQIAAQWQDIKDMVELEVACE